MAKVYNIWATIEELDEETGDSQDIIEEQKLRMCHSREEAEHFLQLIGEATLQ